MKKTFLLLLLFLNSSNLISQNGLPLEYSNAIKVADSLYKIKEYKNSALNYSKAFKSIGWKSTQNDRYNAICSWALAGEVDSAFANVNVLINKFEYSDLAHFKSDIDLINLHSDSRWITSITKIEELKMKEEINYNHSLIALIDSLKNEDQKWRNNLTQLNNNELKDSLNITREIIYNEIAKVDSLNTIQIRDIVKKYGFPNIDIAGENGSNNFWLIVQHQDKYPLLQDSILTLMKIEVDKGKASSTNYAYLIDRVKVNTGQLQIYGTQMTLNQDSNSYEPKPVIEIEKLDERRKSMGLPPEADYIRMMNERYFGTIKH